jgi:hypothetical protein
MAAVMRSEARGAAPSNSNAVATAVEDDANGTEIVECRRVTSDNRIVV